MIKGVYEFKNKKGNNCKLVIEENELENRGIGYLNVNEFYVEDTLIHSLEGTQRYYATLTERYDNSIEQHIFCVKITNSALKNYIDYYNMKNIKHNEAYVKIDNEELEKIYKELPEIRTKEKEEKQERLLRENMDRKVKLHKGSYGFYFIKDDIGSSTTLKTFENLINSMNDFYVDKYLDKFIIENNSWDKIDVTYEFDVNKIDELTNILKNEKEKIELEKQRLEREAEEKREKEIERLKEIAKETGEKQVYDKMCVPCNDYREECNLDIIYKYIMPNGEFEEERVHTY